MRKTKKISGTSFVKMFGYCTIVTAVMLLLSLNACKKKGIQPGDTDLPPPAAQVENAGLRFSFSASDLVRVNQGLRHGQPSIKGANGLLALAAPIASHTDSDCSLDDAQYVRYVIEGGLLDDPLEDVAKLYKFNDEFLSDVVSVEVTSGGESYTVSQFMVLDADYNVLAVTPVSPSTTTVLVNNPLPRDIHITPDNVNQMAMEVLCTDGVPASEFGYFTFIFDLVETNPFLMGVFIYVDTPSGSTAPGESQDAGNDNVGNFQLTSSTVRIVRETDGREYFNGLVDAVTEEYTINGGDDVYRIEITKEGYRDYILTMTGVELAEYFHPKPEGQGPLTIILERGFNHVNSILLNSFGFLAYDTQRDILYAYYTHSYSDYGSSTLNRINDPTSSNYQITPISNGAQSLNGFYLHGLFYNANLDMLIFSDPKATNANPQNTSPPLGVYSTRLSSNDVWGIRAPHNIGVDVLDFTNVTNPSNDFAVLLPDANVGPKEVFATLSLTDEHILIWEESWSSSNDLEDIILRKYSYNTATNQYDTLGYTISLNSELQGDIYKPVSTPYATPSSPWYSSVYDVRNDILYFVKTSNNRVLTDGIYKIENLRSSSPSSVQLVVSLDDIIPAIDPNNTIQQSYINFLWVMTVNSNKNELYLSYSGSSSVVRINNLVDSAPVIENITDQLFSDDTFSINYTGMLFDNTDNLLFINARNNTDNNNYIYVYEIN